MEACAACGPLSRGEAGLADGLWGSFLGSGVWAQAGLVPVTPVRADPTSSTQCPKQSSTKSAVFPGGPPWFPRGPGGRTRQTRWPGARGWEGREPAVHVATWVLAMTSPADGLRQQKCVSPSSGGGKFETRVGGSLPSWLVDEHCALVWRREREPRVPSCLGADPVPGPHGSGPPEAHHLPRAVSERHPAGVGLHTALGGTTQLTAGSLHGPLRCQRIQQHRIKSQLGRAR